MTAEMSCGRRSPSCCARPAGGRSCSPSPPAHRRWRAQTGPPLPRRAEGRARRKAHCASSSCRRVQSIAAAARGVHACARFEYGLVGDCLISAIAPLTRGPRPYRRPSAVAVADVVAEENETVSTQAPGVMETGLEGLAVAVDVREEGDQHEQNIAVQDRAAGITCGNVSTGPLIERPLGGGRPRRARRPCRRAAHRRRRHS